jgi:cytochrome c biogenesis protein CcmG, thiol:disulfide interchange protein DsbE
MSKILRFALPLLIFVGLGYFLLKGLDKDPRVIPSVMIDKPVPALKLPVLTQGQASAELWSADSMKGKVWLLNVWGSWCAACVTEHPLLNQLAAAKTLPIIGLAWKDSPSASQAWLGKHGNPFATVILDQPGRAVIDLGVYGAPESFLIDKNGLIRFKQIGPFSAKNIEQELLPLIEKLSRE